MFDGSYGKIATTVCETRSAQFSPQSHQELFDAVASCLQMSAVGDCSPGAHGPIGDWDVSAITDMMNIFSFADAIKAGISKWDVSSVTRMSKMFLHASTFNEDISRWDVSAVDDMTSMFSYARAFNADISKWDVSAVTGMRWMFYFA